MIPAERDSTINTFKEKIMDTGRNDPCPCGSGLKYKKCCGVSGIPVQKVSSNVDYFNLNREIAYKGQVGKAREDFCREYIKNKGTALKAIEQDQASRAEAAGQQITCRAGCSNCCTQYILGTLQECEAIVYYLYGHKDALVNFVRNYPAWREEVRTQESIFQAVKNAVDKQILQGTTKANTLEYNDANIRFMMLGLRCPFINSAQACSIHEVRPWNCAKPVVTTPKEWCHPLTNKNNDIPNEIISDKVPEETQYFRPTTVLNVMLVHVGVWQILTEGYKWLSDIPGLETLSKDAILDPEVQDITAKYLPY